MGSINNIAILHYQVGHTDGVSLEIDKWRRVIEDLGHQVYLVAGDLGTTDGIQIEEMYHHIPEIKRLYRNTFVRLKKYNERKYRVELERWTQKIAEHLREFVSRNNIDLIIPQNIWSIAANPAVAVALEQVRLEFNLQAIAHHHDFYWENINGVALTCGTAVELADIYLPPRDNHIKHVVINSLAQNNLLIRKGIPSTVVPNIFDFESPAWKIDDYNHDFRKRIGLRENDIIILQATRILARKGIELAIDFVEALNAPERRKQLEAKLLYDGRKFTDNSRIVLVLAGYTLDDITGSYLNVLKEKANRNNVELIHISEIVGHERSTRWQQKIYSLWDTYVHADFVTYPSLWEGWGNQLLEAIRARLPIVIFEYPVYVSDIKDKEFQVISLGSEIIGRDKNNLVVINPDVIESAADQAVILLTDAERRHAITAHNYNVGNQHYSIDALRRHLTPLVTTALKL